MSEVERVQRHARLAGGAYLAIILLGLFGEAFVRGSLVVSGDPAATAANLLASPSLWRLGIAADLLMHVLDVPVIIFLYLWLRPVDRVLALVMTGFNLTQTAVLAVNKLLLVLPLVLLGDVDYLSTMPREQLEGAAYFAIQMHGYGFGIGLIFFGITCLVRGYLIAQSGFLPVWLGRLLQVAGLCYLINSAALLLAPALADRLFPFILLPAFIGELVLALWLLVKRVDRCPTPAPTLP